MRSADDKEARFREHGRNYASEAAELLDLCRVKNAKHHIGLFRYQEQLVAGLLAECDRLRRELDRLREDKGDGGDTDS